MPSGTVLWFNADKHYGFLQPDEGEEQVMLHERDLCSGEQVSWLREGVRVSYDVRRTPRGLRASNIRTWLETRASGTVSPGVLNEGEFREAVHSLLEDALLRFKRDLVDLAKAHGWVK